mgnify:FL=1
MLKKIISLAMTAAIAAACVPSAFAAETMRKHEETMLPAADAYVYYQDTAGNTVTADGTSGSVKVITKTANSNHISIGYLSFDLSKAVNEINADTFDSAILTLGVVTEAGGGLQIFYNDTYFDIDEENITKEAEMNYLLSLNSAAGQNRFWRAGRGKDVFNVNNANLKSRYKINGAWTRIPVDLTSAIKTSLAQGKTKFTLMLRNPGSANTQFWIGSKENTDETKRPMLTINTTERIPTAMTVAGTVTDDTRIESTGDGTTPYGTEPDMATKTTMRGVIMKFDISKLMQYKGFIKSVPLSVYAKAQTAGVNVPLLVYENSALEWDEATCTRQSLLGDAAYNLTHMRGIGFSENETAQLSVNGTSYAKYEYDIAQYVTKLLDQGKTSFTLFFYGDNGTNQITIASKENADASLRPQLTAEIGVSNVLDPEWSIWANTTGVEIPEPAIAPGYELNVFYKRADSTGDYDLADTFTAEGKNANGRFVVDGLDTDTEYTFLIVPSYNDTPYEVFAPKNVTVAADASFAMTADIPALTDEMPTASVAYSYTRGNSAKDAAILVAAAYAADGTLTNVKVENVKNIPIGDGSKTLALDVSGAAEIKAFGWYEDMSPIMK